MLAYTFYENDGRVIRYAEALMKQGMEVEAIVLRREGQVAEEIINGVRVVRVQHRRKNERGAHQYLIRVLMFFVRSMIELTRRHAVAPYDLIHVHSVPDFEVFAAIVPKLMGAKVILDIHDIVPEFYAAKFAVSEKSMVFRGLMFIEKLSASFANHVIIANDLWLEKFVKRSARRDKCSAFINYPDLSVFDPNLRTRVDDGRFVVIYPGTLNWHQGVDIAVKAVARAKERAPALELYIYGEGSAKSALEGLVEERGLQECVFIRPPQPLRHIASIMANADLGVVPKRNDAFGGEAFSTKILEFMALGVHVVVAATKIDTHYFSESLVRFFTPGDEEDLARVLVDAYQNRGLSLRLRAQALEYARRNSWDEKGRAYLDIVEGLLDGRH